MRKCKINDLINLLEDVTKDELKEIHKIIVNKLIEVDKNDSN